MYRQPRFFAVFALIAFGLLLAAPATGSAQTTRVKKLDLNTATQAELEGLKGIGPALAAKIIAARPFKAVADLKNVSGISEATYDAIKGQVTVRSARAVAQTAEAKAKTTKEKAVQTTETKAKTETKAVTEKAAQAAAPVSAVGRVNLNTATQAELEGLKGIGPALAAKIIAARPFKAVADLKNVSGISEATYDAIKGQVTVRAPRAVAQTAETKAVTEKATQAAAPVSAVRRINLNTATQAELEGLKGIGPALAAKIIAARPFKTVADLKNVGGISEATYDAIKGQVTVRAPRAGAEAREAKAGSETAARETGTAAAVQEEEAVHPTLKPGETVNINTATQEQLEALLGIGPVKAQAIIAGRPYAQIEDIMKVKGIKEKTFAKIKDYIVVK
jgi:competence protein ComEA